jgi:hypothetical protein
MLDKSACEQILTLCGTALQMSDFYAGGSEGRYMAINLIQALVSAARVPTQALAVQVLLDNNATALSSYCSGANVAFMRRIYEARKEFNISTHAYKYKDVGPLIVNMVATTMEYLESEDFDDVIPKPTRVFIYEQFQSILAGMHLAVEGGNYKYLENECRAAMNLFFNELAVYLKPVAHMSTLAVEKCNLLWSYYNDTIMKDICKKYPLMRELECDPALICTKYVETMVEQSRQKLTDMSSFTVAEVDRALANNEAVDLNSRVAQARTLTFYPGTQIDLPTDSSVYKNLPPYICAMSSYTGGNNPALPLYQFSMSEGAVLDDPFRIRVPESMELCHTEGRLFYTGYDGFMEEYAPLTFDPIIREASGAVVAPDRIIPRQDLEQGANLSSNMKQDNMPIVPELSLGDQLAFEKSRQEHLKKYNESYYSGLFNNVVDDPLIRSTIQYLYGTKGNSALNLLKSGVKLGEQATHSSYWKDIFGLPGTSPKISGSGIDGATKNHNYFADKSDKLKSHMRKRSIQFQDQTDSKKILEPILKACGIMRMRKNIHDVHDHSVTRHSMRKDKTFLEADSPKCEHCGSTSQLKIHRNSNEVACTDCYKGKGLTKSRRIMNDSNTGDLATSNHPAHKAMSAAYNKYIMRDKKPAQPNESGKIQHANEHWQRFVESAKPYFRNHPEAHLKNFTHHKITEPLPDNYKHTLKNTALIGGRLHSLMEIEKKNMPLEHIHNLQHNFAWHAHHLPKGKGALKHHNLIGAGEDFPTVAQNIEDSRDYVQALASSHI